MQGFMIILFIATHVAAPGVQTTYDSIGELPEITITAPRYEHEDEAWSGLLPEVMVIGQRESQEIAYAGIIPATLIQTDNSSRNGIHTTNAVLTKECAYKTHSSFTEYAATTPDAPASQMIKNIPIQPVGLTVSGNYDLAENDTVYDDVTVTGGNATIKGVVDGDLAVMGGMVDVTGIVNGDAAVFGGNIDIMGTIDGDVAVFGGNIINKGIIDGDLFVIGGTVKLDSGSVVEGDISMVGGTVDSDENAVVVGNVESIEMEALSEILPRISRAFRFPRTIPGRGFFGVVFFLSALIVVYILNLLILLIFPNAIDRIVDKLTTNVWACVGLGLGLEVLYIPLIIIFAVSVIGIPLIPLFVLAVFLAVLFGVSALSLIIGRHVCTGFNWKTKHRVGLFSIGWAVIMIIPFIGSLLSSIRTIGSLVMMLGTIIIYVAATIGLGAVIFALVKKNGTPAKK
jgi:hypothetical protein